jgi:hypothetical protein
VTLSRIRAQLQQNKWLLKLIFRKQNFDPVTSTGEIMVANDVFTRSIAAIIGLSVHIELQSLKANLSANSNDIDKRINAI